MGENFYSLILVDNSLPGNQEISTLRTVGFEYDDFEVFNEIPSTATTPKRMIYLILFRKESRELPPPLTGAWPDQKLMFEIHISDSLNAETLEQVISIK